MEDRVILEVEINDKSGKPGKSDAPDRPSSDRPSDGSSSDRPRREWPGLGGSQSSAGPRAAQSGSTARNRKIWDAEDIPHSGHVFGAAAQGALEGFGTKGRLATRLARAGEGAMSAAEAAAAGGGTQLLAAAGVVIGGVAASFAAVKTAAWALAEGLKVADEAARFSPAARAAQQIIEINRTLGQMQQAREIGPLAANTAMARADLGEEIREFKTEVLKLLLPVVNAGVDGITRAVEILNFILTVFNEVNESVGGVKKLLNVFFPELLAFIELLVDRSDDRELTQEELIAELNAFLEPRKIN